MKITNMANKPVTLRRNCKLADVSPCLAVEDFDVLQNTSQSKKETEVKQDATRPSDLKQRLQQVGLADIDIDQCYTEYDGKLKLVELLEKYNDVFSKHALDCGEAKGFVHRISSLMNDHSASPIGEYHQLITKNCVRSYLIWKSRS